MGLKRLLLVLLPRLRPSGRVWRSTHVPTPHPGPSLQPTPPPAPPSCFTPPSAPPYNPPRPQPLPASPTWVERVAAVQHLKVCARPGGDRQPHVIPGLKALLQTQLGGAAVGPLHRLAVLPGHLLGVWRVAQEHLRGKGSRGGGRREGWWCGGGGTDTQAASGEAGIWYAHGGSASTLKAPADGPTGRQRQSQRPTPLRSRVPAAFSQTQAAAVPLASRWPLRATMSSSVPRMTGALSGSSDPAVIWEQKPCARCCGRPGAARHLCSAVWLGCGAGDG